MDDLCSRTHSVVKTLVGTSSGARRPTLDIDIIVIVENMTADFANAFWLFIIAGGYRPGVRKNDDNTPKYVLYYFVHHYFNFFLNPRVFIIFQCQIQ